MIGVVTHGVLSGAALRRVEETEGLEMLVVTNTIPQVYRVSMEKSSKPSLPGGAPGRVQQAEDDRCDADVRGGPEVSPGGAQPRPRLQARPLPQAALGCQGYTLCS